MLEISFPISWFIRRNDLLIVRGRFVLNRLYANGCIGSADHNGSKGSSIVSKPVNGRRDMFVVWTNNNHENKYSITGINLSVGVMLDSSLRKLAILTENENTNRRYHSKSRQLTDAGWGEESVFTFEINVFFRLLVSWKQRYFKKREKKAWLQCRRWDFLLWWLLTSKLSLNHVLLENAQFYTADAQNVSP